MPTLFNSFLLVCLLACPKSVFRCLFSLVQWLTYFDCLSCLSCLLLLFSLASEAPIESDGTFLSVSLLWLLNLWPFFPKKNPKVQNVIVWSKWYAATLQYAWSYTLPLSLSTSPRCPIVWVKSKQIQRNLFNPAFAWSSPILLFSRV